MRRIVTCMAVAAAMLTATTSARADVFDDNPATASRGSGDLWVFARASNGEILERHRTTNGRYSDWSSIGGNATSGPAAVGYRGSILVFARGTDGATYQRTYANGNWGSNWVSLGGYSTSAPAVEVRRGPEGYVDLAIKGGDNAIYFQSYVPGTGWSGWGGLGGNLTSAPALNSQSAGIVNVWARGTDGKVYQQAWNGSQWVGWGSIDGGIIGAPGAVSRTENVVNVYALGAGNAIYSRSWTAGNGWYPWAVLDSAPMTSAPAAGGDGPDHEWVVARRGDQMMIKEWYASSGWGAWDGLGPVEVPAPAASPTFSAPQIGEVSFDAGLQCTPPGGLLRVKVTIHKKAGQARARVAKIVFFTKGKGRKVKVDRRSPFVAKLRISRPAGSSGRVYARIYFRRSAHGKLHHKTVSRRYVVCR